MTGDEPAAAEVDRRVAELRHGSTPSRYVRPSLPVPGAGDGPLAVRRDIGARGPNPVNAACASTTQAAGRGLDQHRSLPARDGGSADDVTSDALLPGSGSGFLASGAAATDDVVAEAATPFDRRRHGMILGMGAARSWSSRPKPLRERGISRSAKYSARSSPTALSTAPAWTSSTSAGDGEPAPPGRGARHRPQAIAPRVFVSHETYTPARGGSASAEITRAAPRLRPRCRRDRHRQHQGLHRPRDGRRHRGVVAIKSLETGIVPPVPNYKEPIPT